MEYSFISDWSSAINFSDLLITKDKEGHLHLKHLKTDCTATGESFDSALRNLVDRIADDKKITEEIAIMRNNFARKMKRT